MARILILPLLLLPFGCEWSSLLRWREENLRLSKERLKVEGKSRLIKYLLYLLGFTILTQWLSNRLMIYRTWLAVVTNATNELPLINDQSAIEI